MSVVQTSSDTQQLCIRCGSVMVPVMVRGYLPGQRFTFVAAVACEEPGCECLYNILHGYFEIHDGMISPIPGGNTAQCSIDEPPT